MMRLQGVRARTLVALVVACIVVSAATAYAAGDTSPPSVPGGLAAVAGSSAPTIASLTWSASTDDVGVTGYRIWRTVATTLAPEAIGTAAATSFADTVGVPGQDYYYAVSAYDAAGNESPMSALTGPVVATWDLVPHLSYTSTGRYCEACHVPHEAASSSLMRVTGGAPGELAVCYTCHDGRGASTNIKSGPVNSFALSSGHTLEDAATGGDLTNTCAGCHTPHQDPTTHPKLPSRSVNGTTVAGTDNTWCLACHNDTNDWYGAGYPALSTPSLDSSGYPVAGTFPGRTIYADPTRNAHASIPATGTLRPAGSCLYCHASHRGTNIYDGLLERFSPSTALTLAEDQTGGSYAASCFSCHGGTLRSEFTTTPVNIKQFATAGLARSGHRIQTTGGTLPAGAPLPCYDCHNPHGSSANTMLITDALGTGLAPSTAAAANKVREFCFTCHTTYDTKQGWNGTAYAAVGTATVEGIRRDGSLLAGQTHPDGNNELWLPNVTGHRVGDTQNCYQCHGKDYAPGGYNVHNPSGGVSAGGQACYDCHATYQDYMEDGLGSKVGSSTLAGSVYHHVLGGSLNGGAYTDGDYAPGPVGAYPTSGVSNLFCTVCHVDHDQFNAKQGANLRAQFPSYSSGTATNTDFSSSLVLGGLCTSCHGLPQPKDTTYQKDDGTNLAQSISIGGYNASAHQYVAGSAFGDGSTFKANCSKCHNDEQVKDFQTSSNKFGTHWSAARRLLSALGATVTDPLQETHCYRCHARTTDGGTNKTVAGRDWYDAANMSSASERVYAQFQLTSKHPVVASGGNSVECENCHNAHGVSASSPVSNPDNTLSSAAYSTAEEKAAFCLKCHDGTPPAYVSDGSNYVPYSVTLASSLDNKSTYAARAHWTVNGSIGTAQPCQNCHDNHGSEFPKLLGAYDIATSSNRVNGSAITGNNNTVCQACHTSADAAYPAYTRSSAATGYPVDGTWPGDSVYKDTTYGIHRGAGTVVWPGTSYTSGDCKNCHDVHGTANTYDELRGTFNARYFGTCFTCHDADGPATFNVAPYYPANTGGTGPNGTARYGHATVAAGTLPSGAALPCYDCHNPHGTQSLHGLLVVTQTSSTTTITVGDTASTRLDVSTAAGVRSFCLSCHTAQYSASDTRIMGWNGTAYAVVSGGALFEGIDRTTDLKISLRAPHYSTSTQSCTQGLGSACHFNVHYPQRNVVTFP